MDALKKALQESLERRLKELNKKIDDTMAERTLFLDENMHHFARYQIGEEVYDCIFQEVRKVSAYHRRHQGGLLDDKFDIYCIYNNRSTDVGDRWRYVAIRDYEKKTKAYTVALERMLEEKVWSTS
jgi:hypothetical protein